MDKPNLNSSVITDQNALRDMLWAAGLDLRALQRPNIGRVFADIGFDWASIVFMVFAVHRTGWWLGPIAVMWVGNRQRALGNLLHDAGHRNLALSSRVNDLIARIFLAPALCNSLAVYRELHARHHAWLGDSRRDPDYIATEHEGESWPWWKHYLRVLCSKKTWLGSLLGHLYASAATRLQRAAILLWWTALLTTIALAAAPGYAITLLAIWIIARATSFHLVTTFREMSDHFGLQPGGIFSFTRDVSASDLWSLVIHPRSNGYHLTHHLIPSIPYHRLTTAHGIFRTLPGFAGLASISDAYFRGDGAVVRAWTTTDEA